MSTDRESGGATRHIPARLFLNYASEDREWAVWLRARLLEAGVAGVWLDRTGIEGGDDWKMEIDAGLRGSTVLLALLTKSSTGTSRLWVEYEQREARRLLKPIIPLRLEADAGLPKQLQHLHYVDFAEDGADREAVLPALVAAIQKYTLRFTSNRRLTGEPPPLRGPFVGRDAELHALLEKMDGPEVCTASGRQTVAIQGMGGQGKTALAEELIRRIAVRYPGGLLIEERGQVQAPAEVVFQRWAAKGLGKQPPREYDAADVRSLLGEYGELLVLIDDVHESDFEETCRLLDALPSDSTRLVTTRSLNADVALGCTMYQLLRLSDQDARELVLNRLRARASAGAGLEVTEEQDEAIRRLVELVQGHALALKLAAARCNLPEDLPDVVGQLAAGMAEGVDGLAVARPYAPKKDESLAVSLNISLKHLGEYDLYQGTNWTERFAALGVFPDGGRMNPELIGAVWGDAGGKDGRTGAALDGLYRLAMIEEEPGKIYLSHPLLSAFARSLLRKEPERLTAARLRYHDFLTRAAERGFSEPEEHWSRMELYAPHLLHAAAVLWEEWTLRLGDLDALALPEAPAEGATLTDPAAREAALGAVRFAQSVTGYVLRRPALGEVGRRLLTLGLACARATNSVELLDTFVRALGAWYARSNPPAAERYFERALAWAERTKDRAEQGKVLSEYGELQRNRSQLDHAIRLLNRALDIHHDLGDERMVAATYKSLGEAYWRRCDFDTAPGHYQRAVDIYRVLKDISGEADLRNKIGSVKFNQGHYKQAIQDFKRARRMHRKVGNLSMEGEDLNDMGIAYNYLGRPECALVLLDKAIKIHRRLGNRRLEAIAVSNRAGAFYAQGRQDPAAYKSALREAVNAGAIAREVECRFTQVWSLNWEALAQQGLGRPELALPRLEQALALLDKTGGPREYVATWATLGYLLGRDLGQRERGSELLRQAIELMRVNRFERAFGGRSRGDLEALLKEISL
ncbi:MAG TPA: tetratricopeptide repeat protein [Pyrinomonadaceae bacterium]